MVQNGSIGLGDMGEWETAGEKLGLEGREGGRWTTGSASSKIPD